MLKILEMAALGVIVYAMLGLQVWHWWKRRVARGKMVGVGQLPVKKRRRKRNLSQWGIMIVGGGAAIAYLALEDRFGGVMSMVIIAPFFMVGIVVVTLLQRARGDSALQRAETLVRGQRAGEAIEYLRAGLRMHETADRCWALSVLLMQAGVIEEAERCARRATELPGAGVKHWANLAVARAKGGAVEEGLREMALCREREPAEVLYACQYCQMLAEAGRMEEAHEQLRQAEELMRIAFDEQQEGESFWLGGVLLKQCREKVGAAPMRGFPVEHGENHPAG